MSQYNYDSPAPKKAAKLDIWNMLSILMLLLTLCIIGYVAMIFISPSSPLNPFPGVAAQEALPTATITPIQLEPTWTAVPFLTMTETPTLLPTYTLEPSPTLLSLVTPSDTPTPTKLPKASFSANVNQIASTLYFPDAGCNWQGIAGTVVDANNADMLYMTIRLVGFYDGKAKNLQSVSGIAPTYGRSGFEFVLGTVPITSKGELTLQLFDQGQVPLSDAIDIVLSKDCTKNMILVRFKKNP